MDEKEKDEVVARLVLMDLDSRRKSLAAVKYNRLLRIVEVLTFGMFPFVLFVTERGIANDYGFYLGGLLMFCLILSFGYTKLTNERIDRLIKLIGEDNLLKSKSHEEASA